MFVYKIQNKNMLLFSKSNLNESYSRRNDKRADIKEHWKLSSYEKITTI